MPETESFAVYADLNCPYCYALNERFEQLGVEPTVEWRAIEHDPSVQSSACSFEELDLLTSEIASVRRRAPEVDIATPTFRPNTAHVNRVLVTASRADAQRARRLRTALYRALWRDGEDISDPAVIDRHLGAVGFDSLPPLHSVDSLLDAWQSQWEEGEFSKRIPSTVSSSGRVLVGFAPFDDLLRFLNDGEFESSEGETCELREKPRIRVFGGSPQDLKTFVHA